MTSNLWAEGYTSEVEYLRQFYREMSPASIRFAMTLAGVASPDPAMPFRYCELGMGQGLTLGLLAATHPHAEFWGTDFNPGHVARCRSLIESAKLTNVTVLEDSFAEFLERETPQFDIIALHGVYSWVSRENQRRLVDIARQKLKPGGLVYISYNCYPGWSARMPLRQLIATHVASSSGSSEIKLRHAMEFARKVKDAGARFFTANPGTAGTLDRMRKESTNYLLHEYLNQALEPHYFAEIAEHLSAAKLSFATTATINHHIDLLNLDDQQRTMMASVTDPLLRETVRDYMLNTAFRRDLFVKGPRLLSAAERTATLKKMAFALKVPREDVPMKASCTAGEVEFKASVVNPLLDAMARGPARLEQLLEQPGVAENGLASAVETLAVLVALGYADPAIAMEPEARAFAVTRAINLALGQASDEGHEVRVLASPVLGSVVLAGRIERLFLEAMDRGENLTDWTWKSLSSQGHRLTHEGKVLQSEEESLNLLRGIEERFVQKFRRLWEHLGILERT